MNMKNKLYILTILLLTACSEPKLNEDPQADTIVENVVTLSNEQLANADIKVGVLESKKMASTIRVNGKIELPPNGEISISIPLGGYLKATKFVPGMEVKKGEILAIIEDLQYIQLQQDYLNAKTQFTVLEQDYNRQKELNNTKAISDKIFDQTKANYTSQQVNLQALKEKMKLVGINYQQLTANSISNQIAITSPINGFVSKTNMAIGKYISPSDVIIELIDPKEYYVNLTVFEKDISKLAIGQTVDVFSNNQPDQKTKCEILHIGKKISNESTIEVRCKLVEKSTNLLPGMYINAEISVINTHQQALPSEAIVRYNNANYVFIQTDKNSFLFTPVEITDSMDGYTGILNTKPFINQKIVVKGAYTLLMSLKNTLDE